MYAHSDSPCVLSSLSLRIAVISQKSGRWMGFQQGGATTDVKPADAGDSGDGFEVWGLQLVPGDHRQPVGHLARLDHTPYLPFFPSSSLTTIAGHGSLLYQCTLDLPHLPFNHDCAPYFGWTSSRHSLPPALDVMGGAGDWYIRLAVLDNAPDLPDKEFSLDQLLQDPRSGQDNRPYKECKPKTNSIFDSLGGMVLGRHSSSTKEDRTSGGFSSPIVSRYHAQLTVSKEGRVYVSDLFSMHGTTITPARNNEPIIIVDRCPIMLVHGDILCLGRRVQVDDMTIGPVRLLVSFRYHEAGEPINFDRHASLVSRSGASMRAATTHDKSGILDWVENLGHTSHKDPGSPVKEEKTVEVVEVRSASPSSLSSREDHAVREPSGQPIPVVEHRETERKVYGLPYSVLYPDFDDDEDLPRGRGNDERAQSNATMASRSSSRPAARSPEFDRLVPSAADQAMAQSNELDISLNNQPQSGGAPDPTELHDAAHIASAAEATTPQDFAAPRADGTTEKLAKVPVDSTEKKVDFGDDLRATDVHNESVVTSKNPNVHSGFAKVDQEGDQGQNATYRSESDEDYEDEENCVDEEDCEGGNNEEEVVSDEYDQKEDEYEEDDNEVHEENGFAEERDYVDDDQYEVREDAHIRHCRLAGGTRNQYLTLGDDDDDLGRSGSFHSDEEYDAHDSECGSNCDDYSDSEHEELSSRETDDDEEMSEDDEAISDNESADGQCLSESSAYGDDGPRVPEYTLRFNDRSRAASGASPRPDRKSIVDVPAPGSPRSEVSDYGRWYSYSTDQEEDEEQTGLPLNSPTVVKQEVEIVRDVVTIEIMDEEVDQGDDGPPEMLPIEKESAERPVKHKDAIEQVAAEPIEVHSDVTASPDPGLAPPSPPSSAISSEGPVTPPQRSRTLKRRLPAEFDEDSGDIAPPLKAAKTAVKEEPKGGMARTFGLVALGVAIGSVSTIAGLMQLAD